MNGKIVTMIAQYESDGDFTHVAPTPEMLEEAQMQLGVSILSSLSTTSTRIAMAASAVLRFLG